MSTFLLFLLIAVVGFGNTFYILAVNIVDENMESVGPADPFTGNYGLAAIYSYNAGLGDHDTSAFSTSNEPWLLWIFYILITVLIQIVMFNLLISIMGDTFDKVM